MQTTLKAKLIQHLLKKKQESGFTLIELLVVIIIIGILSAIALPSFLNQANRARQSEAATYVGSINRAQQAYYLERLDFAEQINALGLGIQTQTENYTYGNQGGTSNDLNSVSDAGAIADFSDNSPGVAAFATSDSQTLRQYAGVTYLLQIEDSNDSTTTAVLCFADNPDDTPEIAGQIGADQEDASITSSNANCGEDN